MYPLEFSEQDLGNVKRLLVLLKRCKIELNGAEEIVGVAQVINWVVDLDRKLSTPLPPPVLPVEPEVVAPRRKVKIT